MKSTYTQHIRTHLSTFLREEEERFANIFEKIPLADKEKYKTLLVYVHKLLDHVFKETDSNLTTLHLHFERELDADRKKAIAQYLIFRTYMDRTEKDKQGPQTNAQLNKLIARLKAEKSRLTICPADASGANGNKIYKRWKEDRASNKRDLAFYNTETYRTFYPYTLFNCSVKFLAQIGPSVYPYALHIDSREELLAYTYLNAHPFHTIETREKGERYLMPSINTVILFDCENSTGKFQEFNIDRFQTWNRNHDTQFRNILYITFGKELPCTEHIKRKTELMKSRFRIGNQTTYTVTATELDYLAGQKSGTVPVHFSWEEISSFTDAFLHIVQDLELYELRTFRMLNIYSLLLTEKAKHYIIDEIFSTTEDSWLISDETKGRIQDLSVQERKELESALTMLIDSIQRNPIFRKEIINRANTRPVLVVPELFIRDKILKNELNTALEIPGGLPMKTWSEIDHNTPKNILILAYRDQGRYPYHFFPNLLESNFPHAGEVHACLISPLFKLHYRWANYHLLRKSHQYLKHPVRETFFAWKELERKIAILKPERKSEVYWDLENKYSYSDERDTWKVKFDGSKKTRTYTGSDLFIIGKGFKPPYTMQRLDELLTIDLTEEKLYMQNIYEILSEINIYERMINVEKQEAELKIIRAQFDVDDTTPGRLWKILLKKRAEIFGTPQLYERLKLYLEHDGLTLVSFDHFANTWIVPGSSTLTPLNKNVFRAVCDFLELPRIYYHIMQQIRNANVQATKESTRKMSNLLYDLFNDGCFDNRNDIRKRIKNNILHYKKTHPLDEISINQQNVLNDLTALVELIRPEIDLQPVISIKKA